MASKSKYLDEQLEFLFELKRQNKSYDEIVGASNSHLSEKTNWLPLSINKLKHLCVRHASRFSTELRGSKAIQKTTREKSGKTIVSAFADWVWENGYIPTKALFCRDSGYTLSEVKTSCGDVGELERRARQDFSAIFERVIDESSFTDKTFSTLKRDVKRYKRFFITSAVTGCSPHEKGMSAIRTFCKVKNAKMLILPVSDPANQKPRKYKFALHPDLPKEGVVFQDLRLNSNLSLSTIKLQAKAINPLTGLRALALDGSCILASPKQLMEAVPTSNGRTIPNHLMTPGSITVPEYQTKHYMSERTAYLAQTNHILGGVIVELLDDKIFFYRHVQIDPDTGAFTDLNCRYFPNDTTQLVSAALVQLPDWHVGSTCPVFREIAKEIVDRVSPKVITLEDFFDGLSINPHERKNMIARAGRVASGSYTLEDELRACSEEMTALADWNCEAIVVKYGNHDNFLNRWLSEAEYSKDPANHYMGVCLAKGMLEGHAPVEFALREVFPDTKLAKVVFLGINDSFKINGIENVHGHLGAGGKRNPGLKGLECFGPNNSGHTHAPGIYGICWRVGTGTRMQLSYNDGASAWSNTLLIQHKGGGRQLITAIEGKYCLSDSWT